MGLSMKFAVSSNNFLLSVSDVLKHPVRNSIFLIFVLISNSAFAENALTAKLYVDALSATKVNSADLANIIAAAITGKEDSINKVASVSGGGPGITLGSVNDTGYPTTKAVYDSVSTKVGLTGDEIIDGTKTFSSGPIVPTPTYPTLP